MISEEVWKYIYNAVFSIYLPPDSVIDRIVLDNKDGKKEFNNCTELLTHLTINPEKDKMIKAKDINFYLRDNSLYNDNRKVFETICKKIDKLIKKKKKEKVV